MILWCINVYDRFAHLRLQIERIRAYWSRFNVFLFVFCNNLQDETTAEFLAALPADCHHRHPTNGGHHQGVLDAYNFLAADEWWDWHDFRHVIWSHADSIFSDYMIVDGWLAEFDAGRFDVLTVGDHHYRNPRHEEQGVVPWAYNDFTVWTPEAYRKVFPLAAPLGDDGDLYDPVEVVLGRAIMDAGLRVLNKPAWYAWHLRPSRFEFPGGVRLSCDNTIEGCQRVLAGPIEDRRR